MKERKIMIKLLLFLIRRIPEALCYFIIIIILMQLIQPFFLKNENSKIEAKNIARAQSIYFEAHDKYCMELNELAAFDDRILESPSVTLEFYKASSSGFTVTTKWYDEKGYTITKTIK